VTLAGQEVHQSVVVKRHQTVKKVTEAMEALSYNTAIAALMELLNTMRETNCSERHIVKDMVVMLAPFAPHFSEECWERLGSVTTVFSASWPTWEEGLTVEDMMEIPVQVNGKTRGKVRVPRGAEEAAIAAAAMREDAVKRFTEGRELRKQIYVPGRLLNLVVG
jgi:leucyl-tRNA synthetase